MVGGLFAGIGGIEKGFHDAGHRARWLCDNDPAAQAVLRARFGDADLVPDITLVDDLPAVDLIAAGFPCQDLSQAGRTAGIHGSKSGLVERALALAARQPDLRWILLENVPFMLRLDRGGAMNWLTTRLEGMGFAWAYRIVDTRAFGLPQRRRRVLLLASRTEDPRPVLLNEDAGAPGMPRRYGHLSRGFYWTEGNTGLGLVVGATPPLKSGSTLGIPSPPAIWKPRSGSITTPDIRDAERLQGFCENWTTPAAEAPGISRGARWRLVGNAVSVPVASWLAERLCTREAYEASHDFELPSGMPWPDAAWGSAKERYGTVRSAWPLRREMTMLDDFLKFDTHPLSIRATSGFHTRLSRSSLRAPRELLRDARRHIRTLAAQDSRIAASG